MPDGVDLHGVLVLVDAVDDPVGPASCGVVAVEGFIQWLAGATSSGKFSCRLRRACREKMTAYGADVPEPGSDWSLACWLRIRR